MSKPKVSEVKNWIQNEFISNSSATVLFADINNDFFKVVGGGKVKYFYGELAFSDAQRFASDIYFKELYGKG
jgi:hypothetical protein